jgi:hypothetical protein
MTTTLPDMHGGKTPAEHRDAMYEAFARIAQDCVDGGLRPCAVHVASLFGQVSIRVQFSGTDVDSVDQLAECNGFDPDDTTPKLEVFSRAGDLLIGERLVHVHIFTGRPEAPAVSA